MSVEHRVVSWLFSGRVVSSIYSGGRGKNLAFHFHALSKLGRRNRKAITDDMSWYCVMLSLTMRLAMWLDDLMPTVYVVGNMGDSKSSSGVVASPKV
jgi:hypothetical protein